ncbi:MAG: amino acid ABC transporter permease [Treponema sp.]|nr:amino acid ABC transporter permease [Treponema sp.]
MLLSMLKGSGITLSIFILTLVFAIPFAFVVATGRMSKNKIISSITNVFLLIIRGTPLMLQLLIVYFVPKLIAVKYFDTTILFPSFAASIVAFSINYAAYFAEIYRGGIESIPKGQYEASRVLGYSRAQTFFRIILPQVVKRIIPAMGNEVITLVKDTSLVTILSVQELMFYAKSSSNRLVSFTPLLIAGIFYFVMNYVVSVSFRRMEKKLSFYS